MKKIKPLLYRRIQTKLASNKGETLAETLVAVLISAVGLLLLSGMIMAATRIVDSGQQKMKTYYDGMTAMEQKLNPVTEENHLIVKFGSTVTSDVKNINVNVYSDKDSSLVSYSKKE
ncbi:MAG: hypothetical protein RR313_04565 [Anaerovoracaceae bacterium]